MIEDDVFSRRRFVPEKMTAFGFRREENQFIYETDLMDGTFHIILSVTDQGQVHSRVIDSMNEEEYRPLRQENFSGPYVNSVRENYRQLLETVASAVCVKVLFASDQANRITDRILAGFDVKPDFLWQQGPYQSYGTFRHADTKKWFALMMNVKRSAMFSDKDGTFVDILNLKTGDQGKDMASYPGCVVPAWHMNHKTWISVILDESLPDDVVMKLIRRSFELTA